MYSDSPARICLNSYDYGRWITKLPFDGSEDGKFNSVCVMPQQVLHELSEYGRGQVEHDYILAGISLNLHSSS